MRRRGLLRLAAMGAAGPLVGCDDAKPWNDVDITGTSPDLQFALQRAPDGKTVTAADYRGEIVMAYFGYTFCPDVCPLTLQNLNSVFAAMGEASKPVRVLFVTIDPKRDTLASLGQYVSLFGPQFTGLSGSADQLARFARRYRVAYSVEVAPDGEEAVTHSSALFVFGRTGAARLLVPSLATSAADIGGVAADLTRLAREKAGPSWIERLI